MKGIQQYGKNSVVMVDEIICSSPPKYRFPEAGLRIMITNKFGPRTRMRMASRLIINEVRSLAKQKMRHRGYQRAVLIVILEFRFSHFLWLG